MTAQDTLARRFAEGNDPRSIASASNVTAETTPADGYDAVIVGYGHAVYAARRTDGSIVLFEGWRDRSQSTRCQLTKLASGFRAGGRGDFDRTDDGQPGRGTFPGFDPRDADDADADEVAA